MDRLEKVNPKLNKFVSFNRKEKKTEVNKVDHICFGVKDLEAVGRISGSVPGKCNSSAGENSTAFY